MPCNPSEREPDPLQNNPICGDLSTTTCTVSQSNVGSITITIPIPGPVFGDLAELLRQASTGLGFSPDTVNEYFDLD